MAAPRRVILFLCVGLAAASQSGNIVLLGDADPVAMTFWRLIIAAAFLAPLAGRDLKLIKNLGKKERFLLLLAGASLAAHFFCWIAAVQRTTVANATVFFSFNPVITAAAGFLLFKERVNMRLAVSIVLGMAGVAVIGGGDFSFNREHLAGDGYALLCSFLFSVYFLLGKKLRQTLPTAVYVTAVYGIAALTGLVCMGIQVLPLVDYTARTWLCFLLLALVPTVVGHTAVNNALRYIPAGKIATATLSEPLLAGMVAYFAWNQDVTAQTVAGYVLISLSVIVLVWSRGESRKARDEGEAPQSVP